MDKKYTKKDLYRDTLIMLFVVFMFLLGSLIENL